MTGIKRETEKAFYCIAGIFKASAWEKLHVMCAEDDFKQLTASKHLQEKQALSKEVKFHLVRVGFDLASDKPYQRVLNLKGGKQEFDSLVAGPK